MHSGMTGSFLLLLAASACMLPTAVTANTAWLAFSTHATARTFACRMQEGSIHGDVSTCLSRLARKPRYPPDSRGDRLAQLLAKQCIDGASQSESARPALLCECSCDDFDAISRRLLALEREQRLLLQQHSKMERVIRELLQGMQTSDDIALLERLTCQAVVYNVELTSHRDLRLLRSALLKIIGKYSLSGL
jgi:hypothetical protein